jgi:CHAD domain-containing protein
MAFRIRPEESISRSLRRVAKKELASARNELRKADPPHDDAIHEARKSLKKVRAVMEIVAADHGRGLAGCQKRMRKVNRTLSSLRDADAMLAILSKLKQTYPRVFDEHTFARVRRQLASHKQVAMKAARDGGAWKTVDRELRKLRKRAARWRPRHQGIGALAAGIRATYRRGRKALALARRQQRAEEFHEWRKQVKALWYQLRLVEQCSRDIGRDVRVLHQAEAWLGDEHNVVVLCAELSKDASLCDVANLRHVGDRYQCDLRRKAIAAAARIYKKKPGPYVRAIKREWTAWDRHQVAHRTRRRRAA